MTLRLLGELSKSSYNSIFMGNDTFLNETHEHIVKWTCQNDNSHLHEGHNKSTALSTIGLRGEDTVPIL